MLEELLCQTGLVDRGLLTIRLALVLATLGDAMSVLGQAMIFLAIPAAGFDETRELLLLTREQASRINIMAHWRRMRVGG